MAIFSGLVGWPRSGLLRKGPHSGLLKKGPHLCFIRELYTRTIYLLLAAVKKQSSIMHIFRCGGMFCDRFRTLVVCRSLGLRRVVHHLHHPAYWHEKKYTPWSTLPPPRSPLSPRSRMGGNKRTSTSIISLCASSHRPKQLRVR